MSIPVIYRGDDTCANGRTVAIQLPDEDLAGFSLRFDFLGWTFIFDDLKRKGVVRADFSESATCRMPLGTHMGTLRLGKNGKWHTISGTVPVKVSDDVGETYGGDVASVNLAMDVCGGIPDLTGVNTSPKNANALATAFKALVDALKKGSTTLAAIAVAFCACASEPLTVTTAPLGDVDFDNRVVVGVSLNTADFATKTDVTNAVADKVDTGTLQSMSWTNAAFKTAVNAVSDVKSVPVKSVNGKTGNVFLTHKEVSALPGYEAQNYYETFLGNTPTGWRLVFDDYEPISHFGTDGIYFYKPLYLGNSLAASASDLAPIRTSLNSIQDWKTNAAQVVLGNSSQVTAAKGIAIGVPNASGDRTGAAGNSSVAIGVHATTDATASQGIAIGANATASASKAVQIGEGSNANEGTLQFRSWQLVDNAGKIPSERIGGGVVTQGDVTNVVSAVRDLIYDEKTHVTWRRTMYDGNLYYIAVTNVNIVSED